MNFDFLKISIYINPKRVVQNLKKMAATSSYEVKNSIVLC